MPVTAAPPQAHVRLTTTNFWFPVGEELVYHAHWGLFHVAESRTTVNWTNHEGRALLAVRIRTKSNKVISTVYPVDDTVETLIEPNTFLPVSFSKVLNEGRYHTDEVTTCSTTRRARPTGIIVKRMSARSLPLIRTRATS